MINQNVSNLQIILTSLSFKAEKKGKKAKTKNKKNNKKIYSGKKQRTVILELKYCACAFDSFVHNNNNSNSKNNNNKKKENKQRLQTSIDNVWFKKT